MNYDARFIKTRKTSILYILFISVTVCLSLPVYMLCVDPIAVLSEQK